MQYAELGRTGLRVSRLCLGTWTFSSGAAGPGSIHKVDHALGDRLIGAALDAGINLFDSADVYGGGQAETVLGRALQGRRDGAVIVTKGGLRTGLSRASLLEAVDASLQRLGTDRIDVYLAHRQDDAVPLEETLRALDEIVRSGKARHIGFSNWAPWKVAAALEIQRAEGLAPFTHGQMYYSLLGREIEHDYLPMTRHYGLGLTLWSPLAMGLLSGRYTRETVKSAGSRFAEINVIPLDMERMFAVIDRVEAVARSRGVSPSQVALAWLLARAEVSSIVFGVTRVEQLADNIAATDLVLTAEELAELDACSAPPVPYPRWHIEMTNPDGATGRG